MKDRKFTAVVQVSPAVPFDEAATVETDTTGRDSAWETVSMNLDLSPRAPIHYTGNIPGFEDRPPDAAHDTGPNGDSGAYAREGGR